MSFKQLNFKLWTLITVLTIFTIVLRCFVLIKLWSWFIMPFGLSGIGFWHAIGLITFISLLTLHNYDSKSTSQRISRNTDDKTLINRFMNSIIVSIGQSAGSVIIGYVSHLLMN